MNEFEETNNEPSIVDDVQPDGKRKRGQNSEKGKGGKRSNQSFVWDHFQKIGKNEDGRDKVACNHCNQEYVCDSNANGTSSMKTHITHLCRAYEFSTFNMKKNNDDKQETLEFQPVSEGNTPTLTDVSFSVDACRKALAKMIILEELPFHFVEGQGFKQFMNVVQPEWSNLPDRLMVAKDVFNIYKEERKTLKKALNNQRICLTTDTWTSLENLNYMCLTAHFIDGEWKLHKKILNFCLVPNHKGKTLGRVVEQCLVEWGIDKILTISMDNPKSNNGIIDHLTKKMKTRDSTILGHRYLHVRCGAHILNLIVREGLKEVDVEIARVRNMVRYVKSSPQRYAKFRSCCDRDQIKDTKVPCLDVATHWNSTYFMLERALIYQNAFDRLEDEDSLNLYHGLREDEIGVDQEVEEEIDVRQGRGSCVGTPDSDDWHVVELYAKALKVLYQVTERFSGSLYVTCNSFLKDIMTIKAAIASLESSSDCKLKLLAKNMFGKYNKYWLDFDNINQLLLYAHVLDPRYKFSFIRWSLSKYHDKSTLESKIFKMKEGMMEVFNCYEKKSIEQGHTYSGGGKSSRNNDKSKEWRIYSSEEMESDFEQYMQQESDMESKSELERYWLESIEKPNDKFDLLVWWKANSYKYPIVSQMARDILAIPVSTVASESAFSTGGRILDPYRTFLPPKMAEALICAQSWLRNPTTISPREALDEADKIDEIWEELKNDVSSITLL